MKIGLVGYRGSGKSTLFEWLTGLPADPALAHSGQTAMAVVPEPRLELLRKIYNPKKVTPPTLEIIDTPGLSRTHEARPARLALLRPAGCLVLVAAAFDGSDPLADVHSFLEELVLADMEVVSGRIERIEQAVKKPLPRHEREHLLHEKDTLKTVLAALESGSPSHQIDMTDDQLAVTRSFGLLSQKPRMAVVNTADDEENPERFLQAAPQGMPVIAVPAGLELELARMDPQDRAEFEKEMGVGGTDRDAVIRTIMDASGQMVFFTANQKEVKAWLLRKGGTALEAAATIHSDMAQGFIRAEVMTTSDLVRLGSEREVKAQHLLRQEPKDYVVQDDDILLIRFNV